MKFLPNPPVCSFEDGVLMLTGDFVATTVGDALRQISGLKAEDIKVIDGADVGELDSAGAVLVKRLGTETTQLRAFSENADRLISIMPRIEAAPPSIPEKKIPFNLENIGGSALRSMEHLTEVAILIVDILFWSAVGIFNRKQYRKGSFTEQAYYMGSTALPIVGTILFLIGVILALQSAAQLRQFGVTIFVVNLVAIGLSREFAPLMTAIIVSGRTGSAIASEIATMKFTEELDAIKTLGLNPIRFVVVPKLWAMIICMPLLNVFALFIGISGGFLVALTYMDLSPTTFFNQLLLSLLFWDIVTGLIKSLSFAIIITIVGVYRGLNFTGGADGVGRATTSSVVTSIFAIIVMDSIWGILFYFKF
ncbi:MAG: ABC transporter permease [Candidatus Latescibacteria bacterium]|nr:ABC transporter permease [Candidatus Latescibacterota bacterium]